MNPEESYVGVLRALWAANPFEAGDTDYTLLADVNGAYAARSRTGVPALLVPLPDVGAGGLGRRSSGCELLGHASTRFVFQGRESVGPAAALLCLDQKLVDVFVVLALDVARRVRENGSNWSNMVALVEEWQTLLAPRGQLTAEAEVGLWGELWFLSQADDVEKVLIGWRGPDGDATDFFIAGRGVEVKTSRHRRHHHVSLSQVEAPVGNHDAWLLSIWVKVDPGASMTIAQLVDGILNRVLDRGRTLRRLLRAGYSPADRSGYTSAFVVLAEPEWYSIADVPRVRVADSGVSKLRYQVALDEACRADGPRSRLLWRHFHGRDSNGERQ